MANTNFEEYIKDLSPELQEKARQCKTKEELNGFIADNDLELPEEALEIVSGGCGTSTPQPTPDKCNKCNAKVKQCTKDDLFDCVAYSNKRWHKDETAYSSGTYGMMNISAYYRCPNCGIVYKDEIHA